MMNTLHRIVAVSLVLAATRASARELELTPHEGPIGLVRAHGIATVSTRDVSVRALGRELKVLETGPDWVSFFLPGGAPLGDLEIALQIKGESHTATFKVLARKSAEQIRKEIVAFEGPSVFQDEDLLRITKFELAPKGAIVVEGTTKLPKDLFLTVTLGAAARGAERSIAVHKVKIEGGSWKTTFGVAPLECWEGKALLAGSYSALVEFDMARQSPLDRKGLSKQALEERALVRANALTELGTADERKEQQQEIAAHYAELCAVATECLDSLERAHAAAGRCYFRKPMGGCDEDAWVKWTTEQGLGDAATKTAKADRRFLRGDYFDAEAWERWVEKDLDAKLASAASRHQAMTSRFVGACDERSEVEGGYLLSSVSQRARNHSREIYQWNKLQVPETLRSPHELGGGLDGIAPSPEHFERLRDGLLDRFGFPRGK
jgi:hypothetical protein